MNYEATSLFKSYWRGDSKWPCFKAILYSYLYDLIGIGGELSSLTMIFWITFQIILIFVSSETGKIWEILNCFVNIFCWFFFEVKKNSWQKFTSVEPQIYMFSQMWNSWISISTNIHHAVFQPMFCNITSLESSFSHCVHSFLLMLCDYYWFFQSSNYKVMMKAIKKIFYNVMFNVLMGDN